VPEILPKHVFL